MPVQDLIPLTILVPFYNQHEFLPYCLSRTKDWMEVLVLNFGSDKEPDISEYPWAKLHNGEPIHGPEAIPKQLNYGIENSKGDVIVWVPADNAICSPMAFTCVYQLLEVYDIVYTDMVYIDDDDKFMRIRPVPDYEFHACFDSYQMGVSIWYKREAHEKWGMFDEKWQVHDYEWLLRCAMNGATFCHLAYPLYVYRDHTERPTGSWAPEREKIMLEQSAELSKIAKEF